MNDDDVLMLENMDERHWYGKNRNILLNNLVLKHVKLDQEILEIGCGTGTILKNLKAHGYSVTGIEPTNTGFSSCIEKNLNVQNKYLNEYFPDSKYDAILLFDVLEHIENDLKALQHIHDHLLKSGGIIIIAVPSSPILWSQLDVDVFHFRRYTFRTMSKLLKNSNFEIKFYRGWVTLLYPIVFLHRKLINSGFKNENRKPHFFVNVFLDLILKLDSQISLKFFPSVSMMFVATRLDD
jgi:SAM-dependent methyltransferase